MSIKQASIDFQYMTCLLMKSYFVCIESFWELMTYDFIRLTCKKSLLFYILGCAHNSN